MARYLDSGAGDPAQTLGHWLTENLVAGVAGFRCQFGYYGYNALYPFEDILRDMAAAGHPVHLVIGSNKASLFQSHLEWTLEVIEGAPDASITVVAFNNAEFHPKTAHVIRGDGSSAALVGSGNLTEAGAGRNVEAAISVDSREDAAELLQQIADAVDRWRTLNEPGVFHVRDHDDIDDLKDAQIIDEPQPTPPRPGGTTPGGAGTTGGLQVGTRAALWTPARRPPRRPPTVTPPPVTPPPTPPAPPVVTPTTVTPMRWCKELRSSDAQFVSAGTNPTGKLRLSQARFPIDQRRYFRYQLFGNETWTQRTQGANTYDEADVDFDVTIRGNHLGTMTLTVDHAAHREAAQNNVTTVLAWGTQINALLRATSHIGDWVLIERDQNNQFKLTVQQTRPAWAP